MQILPAFVPIEDNHTLVQRKYIPTKVLLEYLDNISNIDMQTVPDFVLIEDNHALVRDTRNMAIINVDNNARQRHRDQRNKILSDKARITTLEQNVANLTSMVMKILGEK